MLMIAPGLDIPHRSPAIDNPNHYRHKPRYVLGGPNTRGGVLSPLGVLQFSAALAIWRGASWGGCFGVGCASANAILQTLWIPAYPILALTILPLDIIAIYGLLAYGGQRGTVRAARARREAGAGS